MKDRFDGFLYHATSEEKLASIRAQGLLAVSYWAVKPIADYYAAVVADEGESPVILRLPIAAFDASALVPDRAGLQEPITTVIGRSEEQIWQAWDDSARDWQASLDLIGSIRYDAALESAKIELVESRALESA